MQTLSNSKVDNKSHHFNERVLVVDQLTEAALQRFVNNEVCAIVVHNYVDTKLADDLVDKFLHTKAENYHHEIREGEKIHYLNYGVDRIGVAYNTTYNHPVGSPEWHRYYNEVLPGTRLIRNAAYPFVSPIDKFRLEMDELWPLGANVANFEGRKMFCGIVRITQPNINVLEKPHCDSIPDRLSHLKAQFSVNIYLSLPEVGGELEVWDMEPLPINAIDKEDINKDWRESEFPVITIKPQKGDMILINTRRPHAVKSFTEGTRVSVQCFFGQQEDNSLALWN